MEHDSWELPDFEGPYESHFNKLNPLDRTAFERFFVSYSRMYGRFMPRNREARILDLACGAGHFLYFLAKMGYRNHLGVDQSEEFVEFIRARITPHVVSRDVFEFLEDVQESFDLIVMNDFLEHIPKERLQPFLRSVRKICDDAGRIFIKTINMTFPLSGRTRYVDFTHEVGFTEESLALLLELSGFHLVELYPAEPRGINSVLRISMSPFLRLVGRRIPRIVTPNLLAIARPSPSLKSRSTS